MLNSEVFESGERNMIMYMTYWDNLLSGIAGRHKFILLVVGWLYATVECFV